MHRSRAASAERTRARVLAHPALGALAAVILVWVFFAIVAGPAFRSSGGAAAYLNAAAPLGILSIAVALLMIGGEFDLSVGSIIGACGMLLMLLTTELGWPVWPAVLCVLLVAAAVGALNGALVVRTRLPSFIVTLGTLFVLRGLTIALPRQITGRTQIGGLERSAGYTSAHELLGGDVLGLSVSVFWWIALGLAAAWLLVRTRAGNWILATGGAPAAARAAGVPVDRVRVLLFVQTALAAAFVAVLQAVRFTGADALRGEQQEFRAIVAVVIGGTLLTGGYGSVTGAMLGALLFGMVQQGIVITGAPADWFQVFLGTMLVAAVLFNHLVRARAARSA